MHKMLTMNKAALWHLFGYTYNRSPKGIPPIIFKYKPKLIMEGNQTSMLKDTRIWIVGVTTILIIWLTLVANWDMLHIVWK